VNGFDTGILEALNQFAREWRRFDEGVVLLTNLELAKGGVMMMALWWAWFRDPRTERHTRAQVIMAIAAAVVAIGVGRGLAHVLPFRERPFNDEGFDFTVPYSTDVDFYSTWSSFPSDHGVLFAALVVSLFFISRPVGIAAGVYTLVFIFLPRLYVGLHWPTDIIAGVLLGAAIAWLATWPRLRELCTMPAFWVLDRYPGLFYAGGFLVTYQIAELFGDVRQSGSFIAHTLARLV